jgi:hypothetical protein
MLCSGIDDVLAILTCTDQQIRHCISVSNRNELVGVTLKHKHWCPHLISYLSGCIKDRVLVDWWPNKGTKVQSS